MILISVVQMICSRLAPQTMEKLCTSAILANSQIVMMRQSALVLIKYYIS